MRNISLAVMLMVFLAVVAVITTVADSSREVAVQRIISEEVAAWNAGDAAAYSRHFAVQGTFTNIYGLVFDGHDAFEKRHAESFATFFKGSSRQEKIRRIRFVTPDVAIVDVDTEVRGFARMPPGVPAPADGVLRTRLLQVFVKRSGEWWIETYHNVDVKAQSVRGQQQPTPSQHKFPPARSGRAFGPLLGDVPAIAQPSYGAAIKPPVLVE